MHSVYIHRHNNGSGAIVNLILIESAAKGVMQTKKEKQRNGYWQIHARYDLMMSFAMQFVPLSKERFEKCFVIYEVYAERNRKRWPSTTAGQIDSLCVIFHCISLPYMRSGTEKHVFTASS